MSSAIIPFLHGQSFDPETTRIMGCAYDMVCKELHGCGQPDIVREIVAKRIIDFGRTGDLDAKKLCARAMLALGFDR